VPEIVEKLEQARTALADVNVDLADHIPSIVVIGDQSTGKSSLLSALTGLQLPTGDNTVTRAPLKIFIRPGKEHKATLQYRLRKPSGLSESK
jgi:ABC-type phosphate/phosphonate transport system ATPase subunit